MSGLYVIDVSHTSVVSVILCVSYRYSSRYINTNFISSTDKNLKLDHELFVEVKPGLSSFADNPKKVMCIYP
jgi:hypothetical protein